MNLVVSQRLKRSLLYLFLHYFSCLTIFLVIQKPLFVFYNWSKGGYHCNLMDWGRIYWYGLPLDLATCSYLTAVPFLIMWLSYWFRGEKQSRVTRNLLRVYDIIIAFLLSVITWSDAALYIFWDFKLDANIFFYLGDPKNAFASVSFGFILLRVLVILVTAVVFYGIFRVSLRLLDDKSRDYKQLQPVLTTVVMLLAGGVLFVAIRGLRIWPNTPGRAYFSKNSFYNHSALNPVFNLMYTTLRKENISKQFQFYPDDKRARLFTPLFPTSGKSAKTLLNTDRPNILVIAMESFSALFVDELGGMKGVTPEFSRLCREGVLFSRCYCSSFRTDRGIVSIVSAYPGQPTFSIMRDSHKIHSLPGLPKTLKSYGYETQALYGGDITFFNMSEYFLSSGHDKLVSEDNFPLSDRTTKWGVPDDKTFRWLYEDIQKKQQLNKRWYTTFLTLSLHDPFDVSYHRFNDKVLNTCAYVDNSFGTFIDALKKTPAWKNLLIVCVADHGFNYKKRIDSPEFSHIPLLLLGGAVKQPQRIDKIVSQTDIVATILGQLHIPHSQFTFSRDVMADTYRIPCAFRTYDNGFEFIDNSGSTIYDNVAGRAIHGFDKVREEKGKAILQTLYRDLGRR